MNNKTNLKEGTIVGLTHFAMGKFFAYTGNLYTQMEIKGKNEKGYLTKELLGLSDDLKKKVQDHLLLDDIDYIASNPLTKEYLKEGCEVLLRNDLEVGKLYGNFSWPELYSHIKGKRVRVEAVGEGILTVFLLDSGQEYYITPEMVAQIII